MKLLVAVAKYSKPNEKPTHFFVQTRNIYYKEKGLDVTVLNFDSEEDYIIDGIRVISLKTYKDERESVKYDILISHAPNIKNHYRFLKAYEKDFKKLIFFFHGHEVLKVNEVYSKPYEFFKDASFVQKTIRNIYDDFKLKKWKTYYSKLAPKSQFIFVSKWMYDEFCNFVKIDKELIKDRFSITYNSVGEDFEKAQYNVKKIKKYDFVTIRANLDGSKYSIDIVNDLAKNNPNLKFLIVGKGKIFDHIKKADNIEWRDTLLNHDEIVDVLNDSNCALMPTRTDAQGLMACEMATFGMPLITSDISVCHEIFDNFNNVSLISNADANIDLSELLKKHKGIVYEKNHKYFKENTCDEEIAIMRGALGV